MSILPVHWLKAKQKQKKNTARCAIFYLSSNYTFPLIKMSLLKFTTIWLWLLVFMFMLFHLRWTHRQLIRVQHWQRSHPVSLETQSQQSLGGISGTIIIMSLWWPPVVTLSSTIYLYNVHHLLEQLNNTQRERGRRNLDKMAHRILCIYNKLHTNTCSFTVQPCCRGQHNKNMAWLHNKIT